MLQYGLPSSDGNRDGALIAWSYGSVPADTDDIHIYHNSFAGSVGENCYTPDIGIADVLAQRDEKNVLQNGEEAALPNVSNVDNLSGTATYFDGELALTGPYRLEYLGTHGAEISMPDGP